MTTTDPTIDNRPRFAIGHLSLEVSDVETLTDFYTTIGMREVVRMDGMAILELRGGTHIVLHRGEPGRGKLDLMVDDVDETHGVLASAGATPSGIEKRGVHRVFTATDPEGNLLMVNSSHAIGAV